MCFRLKPTETRFLADYRDVMKPMAQALDILQAEKKAYMGYLLPTLTMLQEKLRARREVTQTCGPLVDALLAGIARRFEATMCDPESIAAAILHPKFRKDWTDDATVLDKGKLAMFVYMYNIYILYMCNKL